MSGTSIVPSPPSEGLGRQEHHRVNTAAKELAGKVRFVIDFFGDAPDSISDDFKAGTGSNFFTILAEFIDTVRVESLSGADSVISQDIRQMRIDGPLACSPGGSTDDVAAPGMLLLLGAGLAPLGLRRQRLARAREPEIRDGSHSRVAAASFAIKGNYPARNA